MLCAFWIVTSFSIALLQLLVLTQAEWIVNGYSTQGLFALCNPWECTIRPLPSMLPLLCHFFGTVLFLVSTVILVPTMCCSTQYRYIQMVANIQLIACILMGFCLFTVPLDMDEIKCTIPQLLRSFTCRIGWAYAVSAVCCMLSICCPVLGKIAADERKRYAVLESEREHFL